MYQVECQCGKKLRMPPSIVGRPAVCSGCKASLRLVVSGVPVPDDFHCRLVIKRGPVRVGEQILLGGDGPIDVGRAPGIKLLLGGSAISDKHCRLLRAGSGWKIIDANSQGGTFVNTRKVASRALRGGDVLKVGDFTLTYLGVDAPDHDPDEIPPEEALEQDSDDEILDASVLEEVTGDGESIASADELLIVEDEQEDAGLYGFVEPEPAPPPARKTPAARPVYAPPPPIAAPVRNTAVAAPPASVYPAPVMTASGQMLNYRTPATGGPGERTLEQSDPAWVGKLKMGTNLIVLAMGISIASNWLPGLKDSPLMEILLVAGLYTAGIWFFTWPEPDEPPGFSLRLLLRIVAIAAGVGQVGMALAMSGSDEPGLQEVQLAVAGLLGELVQFIVFMIFLRKMALRIPYDSLATQVTIVMFGLGACILVMVGGGIVAVVSGSAGAAAGACFALIGLVVFRIWYIAILFQFNKAIEFTENTAQRNAARRLPMR